MMDIEVGVRHLVWTSLSLVSIALCCSCVVGTEVGSPTADDAETGADTAAPGESDVSSGSADNEGATGVVLPGTGSTSGDSTGAVDQPECRDALECTTGCVFESFPGSSPLDALTSCFLQCEPTTVAEAVTTLSLLECGTDACIEQGECDALLPDGGTGTTDGGGTAGDTSTVEEDAQCVACLLTVTAGPEEGQPCFAENLACQ